MEEKICNVCIDLENDDIVDTLQNLLKGRLVKFFCKNIRRKLYWIDRLKELKNKRFLTGEAMYNNNDKDYNIIIIDGEKDYPNYITNFNIDYNNVNRVFIIKNSNQ